MIAEIWKQIEGFNGYEVSNTGRIRRSGKIKNARPDRKGYLSVTLWVHGKQCKRQVSRLVATAFIGTRPDNHVVAHNNGDNSDNRAENLRYATPTDNEADKAAHRTKLIGERHHQAKLTKDQVCEIRRRFKPHCPINSGVALAAEFGVSAPLITNIVKRKVWKWL